MNIPRIIIFCIGICLLAGCTPEQDETFPTAAVPLYIASAALPEAAMESSAVTRTPAPLQTGNIGVFCTNPTGYPEAQKNVKYTYTSSKWTPEAENKGVYLLPQEAQVCAYYPQDTRYTNSAAIPLAFGEYAGTVDILSAHDPQDICYATNQAMSSSKATATFALKHAMALLKLTLTRPADVTTACRITQLKLENSNLMNIATQNITTGEAPTGSTVASLTWTPATALVVPANGSGVSVTLRMIPCTLATGGLKLTFMIENKPVSVTIAQSTLSQIVAGKLYNVSLTIGAVGINIANDGVKITEWENVYNENDPVYNTRP